MIVHDEAREADVQKICWAILEMGVESTGDYGMGGQCPFCYADCRWDDSLSEVIHNPDCVYLIAKDLTTKGG